MDVVLGVAVTGPVARLALVGSGAQSVGVIDQSVVDLEDNPIGKLTETVAGTNRLLAGENHRLVGTRVCWTDRGRADQLRRALEDSGVHNVGVLSESQAVAALMRAAGRPGAALVMDDATATLSLVDPAADPDAPPTVLATRPVVGASSADATAALNTMMANLSARPDFPDDVLLVGASPTLDRVADQLRGTSTMRVQVADDPTFALARGAAIAAAPPVGDATAMAPAAGLYGDATAMSPAAGLYGDATAMAPAAGDATTAVPAGEFAARDTGAQQLAYSMTDDAGELGDYEAGFDEGFDEGGYDPDYDPGYDAETSEPARFSRRSLIIGNAVIAFAVVGLASLAAAVAIAVRPTASQQPVVGVQNAAPGKFLPILPSQQQAPVPPPPVDQPNAGFQGGTVTAPQGGGPAPAVPAPQQIPQNPAGPVPDAPPPPVNPGVPGYVPVPIPVPVPFPGWRPNYPPYNPYPPYTPPTTTSVSPPTTTTLPTTTSTLPTTTSTLPTTTSTLPTTTSTLPTTTSSPPTTSEPPTTTHEPPTTTYSPPTTTQEAPTTVPSTPKQTTQAPLPTQTQQTLPPTRSEPAVPQEPRSGGRHGF